MKRNFQNPLAPFFAGALFFHGCATITNRNQNLYLEKGLSVFIEKVNGEAIDGELIAVKNNALLLSGRDVGVDVKDVKIISNRRSTRFGQMSVGAIIGGAIRGYSTGDDDPSRWIHLSGDDKAAISGILFGSLGFLVGGVVGAVIPVDSTIEIEGIPAEKISACP